jgi:hypothetical protein
MITQLNPPLPIVTPKGKALAHIIIDTGIENEIQWVCFQDATGECWTWKNPQVRAQINFTHGREHISPFYNPEDVALKKEGGYFCQDCKGHNECDCEEEEDDDECTNECECCECSNAEYWQSCHNSLEEQNEELRVKFRDSLNVSISLKDHVDHITNLLITLHNDDHIFLSERDRIATEILKNEEYKYGFNGRIVKK